MTHNLQLKWKLCSKPSSKKWHHHFANLLEGRRSNRGQQQLVAKSLSAVLHSQSDGSWVSWVCPSPSYHLQHEPGKKTHTQTHMDLGWAGFFLPNPTACKMSQEKKRKKPTPTHRFILDSSMIHTHSRMVTNSGKIWRWIWCTFVKSHHCEIHRWVSKSSTASSSSAVPAKKQQAPCTTTLPFKTSVPFLLLRRHHHHHQKKNLLQRHKLHKIEPVPPQTCCCNNNNTAEKEWNEDSTRTTHIQQTQKLRNHPRTQPATQKKKHSDLEKKTGKKRSPWRNQPGEWVPSTAFFESKMSKTQQTFEEI